MTATPGVQLVAHLKFPNIAGRAAERRLRRQEGSPCYHLTFLDATVYACVRDKNHKGRHHASNGRIITATWRSE